MGLNRMMLISKHTTGGGTTGDNAFVITMGQQGYQYGFSRYNATFGEVEGNVQHDGKVVTLVMLCYYSGYLDFAFNIEGVSSGRRNVTVKITSAETGASASIEFPKINYQSYVLGKQFKVELIFN